MGDNNIDLACSVLDDKVDKRYLDNYFLRLYSFTNENLSGYMRTLSYSEKSVLTTGSSCDQILNLINYGCKDISLLDINPFVKYYYELKRAAIMCLSRDDYMNFLHSHNFCSVFRYKTFNRSIFNELRKYMSDEANNFWESLITNYDPLFIKNNLFMDSEVSKRSVILNNDYLNEEEYKKLRKKIDDVSIKFYQDNVYDLKCEYDKYDYIFLSNILDYIFNFQLKTLEQMLSVKDEYVDLVNKLMKLLKDDGKAFFHYVWNFNQDSDYNCFFRSAFEKNHDFDLKYVVDSSHMANVRDAVFTYKKRIR